MNPTSLAPSHFTMTSYGMKRVSHRIDVHYIAAAQEWGFTAGKRAAELVEESQLLPMCQSISAFTGLWDEAFIEQRSV